ncbi:MAG TPA: LacI family DNA-binding transcriptional regulator [Armatimonadota bacterium]
MNKREVISITSLAKRLGLSKSTVHAALTETGTISQETRARVRAAADQLGYRPNLLARGLRTQRSTIITVITNTATWSHTNAPMLHAADQLGKRHGYLVLSAYSDNDPARERQIIEYALGSGVAGLLIEPIDTPDNQALYRQAGQQVPLGMLNFCIPQLDIAAFATDESAIGHMAARHLLTTGRRRLVYLGYAASGWIHQWVTERLRGVEEAAREEQAPVSTLMVTDWDEATLQERVAQTLHAYLDAGGAVEGLIAANDTLALGAISALRARGQRVPADVAVVGVDNSTGSAMAHPPLTTLEKPMAHIGHEAMRFLLERMAGDAAGLTAQQYRYPPTLIVRASTQRNSVSARACAG